MFLFITPLMWYVKNFEFPLLLPYSSIQINKLSLPYSVDCSLIVNVVHSTL